MFICSFLKIPALPGRTFLGLSSMLQSCENSIFCLFTVGVSHEDTPAGMKRHILSFVCPESGIKGDETTAWECGIEKANLNPPLARHTFCGKDDRESDVYRAFNQYQGGPASEGGLTLHSGLGIEVGDSSGLHTIVVAVHFPRQPQTQGHFSGVAHANYTFVNVQSDREDITPVYTATMFARGFIGPNSVGSVAGSLLIDREIKLVNVFIHFHASAIDAKVFAVYSNGSRHLLIHQNPATFQGTFTIGEEDTDAATLSTGDRLELVCTSNNTKPALLRVE